MDPVNLVFQGGVLLVQSVVCILYCCRTNDKLDAFENHLKNNHMRIIKLEKMNELRYVPPVASAPPYIYSPPPSHPKSYESYNI